MNLDDYRAMKAQEEAEKNAQGSESHAQTQQVPTTPVQPVVQEAVQSEPTPAQVGTEAGTQVETVATDEPKPQVFEVNGEQITLEELQRGYLRQSDYTRKTQELSRKERELLAARDIMQTISEKPELAQQLGYDPQSARIQTLEAELLDYRLQQEINSLSSKYADFDTDEVINFALSRQMDNLEDAYLLNKQYKGYTQPQAVVPSQQNMPLDVEAIKAQIRAELLAEQNTTTIINGSGTPPAVPAAPQISEAERRIARKMGLSDAEYVKWR